ncbi:Uncharacterised protein [uncultured archaeon]|nr:Uncharacterised protein [uncultured archaeon]
MIRGKGRVVNRPGYSKGKEYPKYFVYIPIEVARDSAFPFQEGDEVEVIVDMENNRLIIEKCKDSENVKKNTEK